MARALSAARTPPELYEENSIQWNPGVSKAAQMKGAQGVSFYMKSKLDPVLSKAEGRPRYQKIPYVRVTQPGDRDNIVNRQAWIDEDSNSEMADNLRFSEEWARFQRQLDGEETAGESGTPLGMWPAIGAEQVDELKHFNIFTVEQLADMTDSNAQRFMGMRALQRLAKDYLEAAKDGSVVTRLHGELEEQKARVASQEKALAEQAEMLRQLREMVEAQRAGRAAAAAEVPLADPLSIVPPAGDPPPQGDPPPARGNFLRPRKPGKPE